MRVLVDTCVFADQVCSRAPFDIEANQIFSMAYSGIIELLVLPTSFATCSYIGSRMKISPTTIAATFDHILYYATLAKTSKATMKQAIDSGWKDFEDAMQYHTALAHHADAIITRNKKDFEEAEIPVYTPQEFLDEMVDIID